MAIEQLTPDEEKFILSESQFVNGRLHHKKAVAMEMARDHRYLINEKAKLYIEFFKMLAKNEKRMFYDARNEYACKCARVMIDALKEHKLL